MTNSCCGRSASYLRRTWKASPLCMHSFHSHYSLICVLFRKCLLNPSRALDPPLDPGDAEERRGSFHLVDKASVSTGSCFVPPRPPPLRLRPLCTHSGSCPQSGCGRWVTALRGCWPCFHQDSWPPVWRQWCRLQQGPPDGHHLLLAPYSPLRDVLPIRTVQPLAKVSARTLKSFLRELTGSPFSQVPTCHQAFPPESQRPSLPQTRVL